MPLIRNQDDWAKTLRKQVRRLASGWTVRESPRGNKVTLKVRHDNKEESITLSFSWNEQSAGDVYTRIRNISTRFYHQDQGPL